MIHSVAALCHSCCCCCCSGLLIGIDHPQISVIIINNMNSSTNSSSNSNSNNIVLPPPSADHPLPSLAAALRLDNAEQLLALLLTRPSASMAANVNRTSSILSPAPEPPLRQFLVFGSEGLRTLLLRHVFSILTADGVSVVSHSSTKGKPSSKQHQSANWESIDSFSFPQKSATTSGRLDIVGTHVLSGNVHDENDNNNTLFNHNVDMDVRVITYFLRPDEDLRHTPRIAAFIRKTAASSSSSSSSSNCHVLA